MFLLLRVAAAIYLVLGDLGEGLLAFFGAVLLGAAVSTVPLWEAVRSTKRACRRRSMDDGLQSAGRKEPS